MSKEIVKRSSEKYLHYKGTGFVLSRNVTNKGSIIFGIGITFRFKYLVQIALADELWYDGDSGKKYIIKKDGRSFFIGWLAIRY